MNENTIWPGWKLITQTKKPSIGYSKRQSRRTAERKARQKSVLEMISSDYPELIYGNTNVVVNNNDVIKWIDEISSSTDANTLRDKHNFLSLGLTKGIKELGWQVNPIPLMSKAQRDCGISITEFERQSDLQIAIKNYHNLLCKPLWLLEPSKYLQKEGLDRGAIIKTLWGQIIFSAALYGGLFEKSTLLSLIHVHTNNIVKFKKSKNCWITFFGHGITPDWLLRQPPRRRWYLDELTYILLGAWDKQQCQKHVPSEIHKDRKLNNTWHDHCLSHFAKFIGLKSLNIGQFLQDIKNFWNNKIPSYIVYHCEKFGRYTAIPEQILEPLLRNCKHSKLLAVEKNNANDTIQKQKYIELDKKIDELKPSRQALNTLKKALYQKQGEKKPSRRELEKLFSILLDKKDLSPIAWSIIAWLQQHNRKNKPRTVYKYCTMVGSALLDIVGSTTLCSENINLISSAYQTIISEASTVSRRNDKYKRLLDFQNFLCKSLGGPKINIEDLAPGNDLNQQASANIISENEFICIKNHLATQPPSEENTLLRLIFIVLFRSGARIGEILTAKMRDIQWTPNKEGELLLHINSNNFGSIKSPAAVRRLPLHLTLTESEKIDFLEYLNEISFTRKNTNFIFSLEINHAKPIPENKVRSALQYAMRGLTGNNTLTLHHLRHSFANHAFAALLDIKLPFSTPEHYVQLKKLAIYQRSYLYLLADLMGHHSPEITISSYIHFMDLALRSYLANYTNPKSDIVLLQWEKIISSMEQITPEAWRKRLQRCPDDLFSPCTSSKFQPKTTTIHSDLITPTATILQLSVPQHKQMIELNLASITELLRQLESGRRYDEIAMRFHIEPDALPALELAIYRTMMATNSRNGYRHIHPHNNKYNGVAKEGFPAVSWNGILHIMRPPAGNNSNQANYVYQKLQQQLQGNPQHTNKMIKIFSQNFCGSENHLPFRLADEAGQFITWLKSILPPATIRYKLAIAPNGCQGAMPVAEQMRQWCNHTGFKHNEIQVQPGQKLNTKAGTGYLQICFKDTGTSCYGYRYALITMATVQNAQYFLAKSNTE